MTACRPDLLNCAAPSRPPRLLFCNRPASPSCLESALLQVSIPLHLKSFRMNTSTKPRGRVSQTLTLCYSLLTRASQLDPSAISTTKAFGIASFADAHPLSHMKSYSYENRGGGANPIVPLPPNTQELLQLHSFQARTHSCVHGGGVGWGYLRAGAGC